MLIWVPIKRTVAQLNRNRAMSESTTAVFLFTELAESTDESQRWLDPAQGPPSLALLKLMREAGASGDDHETQAMGGGLLAVFASAAAAVRSAINIQQAARRPIAGTRCEVRIGIHAGEAIRRGGMYVGTPLMIARRLCDSAAARQIVCSKLVAELLATRQAFSFRGLGTLRLGGLAGSLAASEVLYDRNDPSVLLDRTPFVGRTLQLDRLAERLAEARLSRGGVVMIAGEPGIGKTRTLEEFAEIASQSGTQVLRGSCYDGEWQPPYGPFAEAIAAYARHTEPRQLQADLGCHASTIAPIVPTLRLQLRGVPGRERLDRDEERFRLLDAVAQFLLTISRRVPLTLILDDLHWADQGTIAMMAHLARFVPAGAILLIGAFRDVEIGRDHPLGTAIASFRGLPCFETLTLGGLESGEVTELLDIVSDGRAPDQLVKALGAETDGNPLFIREMLLHLIEEGKLLRPGEGWAAPGAIANLAIPDGVREVIGRRLLRLPEEARHLLTVGAAFNGAFAFALAARAAELDEAAALAALDAALDARLLKPVADGARFDFTHALIRHTLYSALYPIRRARLHRRIADTMEQAWGERAAEHAADLAFQFWRSASGGGAERGANYAIAAADQAEAAYAYDEVTAFVRIGLELLPSTSPLRPRLLARLGLALTWSLKDEEARRVVRQAGDAIAEAEGTGAAADYYDEAAREMHSANLVHSAWEVAREGLRLIGERRDLTWASLTNFDLDREQAQIPQDPGVRIDCPRQHERRAVLRELPRAQLAERGIEPPYESRAEILRTPDATPSAMLLLAGDYRRSVRLWQEEAADAERRGRITWAVTAWANLAIAHTALGEFPQAHEACGCSSALLARATGNSAAAVNMSLMSALHDLRIALDEGWDHVFDDNRTGALLAEPAAENQWAFAMVRVCAGYIFARLNQAEMARQMLRSLPDALDRGAAWEPTYAGLACDAAATMWLLNSADIAEVTERNLHAKVLAPDFRYPSRDSRLSMARLSALKGRFDEAVDWFARAREVLDEVGARPLRAITDFDEGLMYLRRAAPGDQCRARPLLDAAAANFRSLAMTGWIRRAEEVLSSAR